MAMIQMDLPSANRFVSSLSKSLQALCHGCMDFDTEIEIVGYINVNIDCGSKVDYVLNEKVSKSTNNSMKFISNSFLAKKDEPKTDRSCSPIPELNVKPARPPPSSSYASSQLYKSSGIFSPHSQVLRGSQKRSWPGGDWRSSHRKMARGPRAPYDSSYNQSQSQPQPQHSEYSSQQSSTFPKPSTSQQDFTYSDNSQSQVNVKSEAVDETGNSYDQNVSTGENASTQESSALVSDVNIKSDPDSAEPSNNSNTGASFLNPQSTDGGASYDGGSEYEPTSGQNVSENESFFKTEHDESASGQEVADYNNEPPNDGETSQAFSETDVSFQAEEGHEYGGEESGDGSQFDVIEIDDDDEDLAAFTDPELFRNVSDCRVTPDGHAFPETSGSVSQTSSPIVTKTFISPGDLNHNCTFCSSAFLTRAQYRNHLETFHRRMMPYHCHLCSKVFFTTSGLWKHVQDHNGRKFTCPRCPLTFKRNYHLQRHIAYIHCKNYTD